MARRTRKAEPGGREAEPAAIPVMGPPPEVRDAGALFVVTPLDTLQPSEMNARRRVPPERLKELAASIAVHGVLEPLIVRPHDGTGRYEIVAGERRFRAAQLAGVPAVPVVVRPLTDAEVLEFTLIENVQREDLPPLDEARGLHALVTADALKYTPTHLADRLGVTARWVWDRLRLLALVPALQQHLEHKRITVGHAIALSKLAPDDQRRALDVALFEPERALLDLEAESPRKAVSVRELEAWIARHVRFDAEQARTAAPLDFEATGRAVEAARTQARQVVAISHDHHLTADAREGEKVYLADRWKRADGQRDSKVCDHAVLGVFAVGPDYGSVLEVCVTPGCDVHWKKERREKERAKKRQVEASVSDGAEAAKRQQQREQEEQRRKQWTSASPQILAAVRAALTKAPIAKVIAVLQQTEALPFNARRKALPTTAEAALRALTDLQLSHAIAEYRAPDDLPKLVKPLGVNVAAVLQRAAAKAGDAWKKAK